ncbi:MAG: DUF5320 domain-containing protein [Spirochaetales bacterium]|nr:DUF5320 domain-containing protein [Spirochaetales bacterium]
MNGNRRGPEDKGSRTGRQMGYCSGYDKPGRENRPEDSSHEKFGLRNGQGFRNGNYFGSEQERGLGRGAGQGRGFGRGHGRGFGRGQR